MNRLHITAVALAFALAGCGTLDYTVAKRSTIDAQIAAARADTTAQLSALSAKELGAMRDTVKAHETREQAAADYLFKGEVVAGGLKTPTRPEQVMEQSINQTATQLPSATPAAQAAAFKALQTELDETKVTTEQLKAQYERELGVARAEGAAKETALKELDTKLREVDKARVEVLTKAKDTEAELSDKRKAVDAAALADKQRQVDAAKHSEALKRYLMIGLGIVALVAGAGAVYLPIPGLKAKLTILAIAAGGLCIAIPWIEWWMVLIAIAIVTIPIGVMVLLDYKREHGDATDTYRALNEVRVKAKDAYDAAVAPILASWHTDPATTQRIDARLKQVGDT